MPSGFYDAKNVPDYGVGEMGQNIQKVTAAIGGIFQERYQQKQYQDFIDGPQKDYEAKLHQVQDLLLDETNPEGPSQGIKMMSGALSTYMDEAGRYKNNPLISGRAQAAFQGNNYMLHQIFTSKMNEAKIAYGEATTKRMNVSSAATVQETQARTGLINEQTAQLKAGRIGVTPSGRLGKASSAKGGPQFLTGGPGMIDPNAPADTQLDQAYASASANLTNPGNKAQQDQRAAEMNGIRKSLAQQDVIARAARGEQRDIYDIQSDTTKQEAWDPTNEKHISEAEALVDPEDVKNRYIYTKMREEQPLTMPGVTPEMIDQKYGWMKDPDLANPNAPVTREMSEINVGKVLLGQDGWNVLTDQKTKKAPLDLTDAAKNLPNDFTQLQGPLRRGMDAAVGSMVTGTVMPKTADEVKALIKASLKAVAGQYIGGGHPNDKVHPGVLKSRYAAAKFVDAIADKYSESIAERLGLNQGKAKAEEPKSGFNLPTKLLREYTPLGDLEDILGGAAEVGKSLLGKLQE